MNFDDKPETKQGLVGEGKIALFLMAKGYSILPVYQIEKHTGKGPQLFTIYESLVAPDMLAFKGDKALWIEAKHKTAFSWYRRSQVWTTGIDKRHYEHYCQVDDKSPWPVWLLFLHKGGVAKDSPPSEGGLFGNRLSILRSCIHHTSEKWANGMVYWEKDSLIKIASLADVNKIVSTFLNSTAA